jgi:hypothetical protein
VWWCVEITKAWLSPKTLKKRGVFGVGKGSLWFERRGDLRMKLNDQREE